MNIKHFGRLVIPFILPGMNTVYRTDVHTRGILRANARFTDDIRHFPNVIVPRPLLFTPEHPQLGRYDVRTTAAPLTTAMVDAGEGGRITWTVDDEGPLDAFGTAGLYDRSAVSQLFGGRVATVARGWIQETGRVESVTLISPYPEPSLDRLNPGTLIVRHIICCT